ncbi:hypothetical protein AB5N19_09643 [Seiridium cardinale]
MARQLQQRCTVQLTSHQDVSYAILPHNELPPKHYITEQLTFQGIAGVGAQPQHGAAVTLVHCSTRDWSTGLMVVAPEWVPKGVETLRNLRTGSDRHPLTPYTEGALENERGNAGDSLSRLVVEVTAAHGTRPDWLSHGAAPLA